MSSKEFLPQYAAQAVIDLEMTAKRLRGNPEFAYYASAVQSTVGLIRHAVHVVLPENGEVYRSNDFGGEMPTADECDSFAGLPAPITCFEYPWTYRYKTTPPATSSESIAPRRITIVCDGKQTHEGQSVPSGMVTCATFVSVVYVEAQKIWSLLNTDLLVATPLAVSREAGSGAWGADCMMRNLYTGKDMGVDDPLVRKISGEFHADLNAVVQCCHALRAGATFKEQQDKSASRRWKFEKHGVGGFTYHILKLPERAVTSSGAGGSGAHESPRFHVRRAHIRKLPTGLLTFVRQCFVGDRERGVVDKHYEVGK